MLLTLTRHGWRLAVLTFSLVAVGLCCGCGEDETTGPPIDTVAAGWTAFGSGDFETGISNFQSASSEAPGWAEPYTGLGWCYTALVNTYRASGQENLANDNLLLAETNFESAISKDENSTDAWAGLAIVRLVLGEYLEGGKAAHQALELGQDKYVFRYDSTVNADALRIVLAECAFYLGDYAVAEAQVELVDFALILESTDPDYLEQLLEAIGRLSRQ